MLQTGSEFARNHSRLIGFLSFRSALLVGPQTAAALSFKEGKNNLKIQPLTKAGAKDDQSLHHVHITPKPHHRSVQLPHAMPRRAARSSLEKEAVKASADGSSAPLLLTSEKSRPRLALFDISHPLAPLGSWRHHDMPSRLRTLPWYLTRCSEHLRCGCSWPAGPGPRDCSQLAERVKPLSISLLVHEKQPKANLYYPNATRLPHYTYTCCHTYPIQRHLVAG